ncbi:MAG: alpha/beta hydrolase [Candidatus Nanopelagicales bacterium]
MGSGRSLAYLEYGDPSGVVVLSHHGGLLSGSDVAALEGVASSLGIRLVSFDRPGIGGSTPQPGRTTADGGRDVVALLDALGIPSAYLLGWSMGGQYALASAAALGSRALGTAVVAGCVPLDDPAALAELNAMDRRFTAMAADHRRSLETVSAVWGGLARFSPSAWARAASKGETEADVAAVRAHAEELAASAHEVHAQPDGIVEEYLAWARPWGFELSAITTPVTLWQGDDDHLVPPVWAQRLADGLPDASVRAVPGAGHFLLLTHGEEILQSLVGA